MRVPLSWLCDFAPFGDRWQDVAGALDDLGLVVEAIEHVGQGLDDVVVAEVAEIAAIDGADRVRRVVVEAGDGPVEVVCGAWNFHEGDRVPLARVGTVLPGDFRIERRTLRGVVSNGMLCSARELGLGEDHAGILVVDGATPLGTPIGEALGVQRDVVFDVAVETNRPDAFSIAGVARDAAARMKVPFALPTPAGVPNGPRDTAELADVTVVDADLCPRFTASVLTGVTVGPSPRWVARRLTLAGMRPINNVVDASNYVMLELGQPTHPYDLDRVAGSALRVRASRPGEAVVTLDGTERALGTRSVAPGDDRRDCLICDGDDSPIGIAGVMGGASTEIGDETVRVLLEAAYFDSTAIARTAKRLALRTEASARFERGCDPGGIDLAVARLAEILAGSVPGLQIAPGRIDRRGVVPGPIEVPVRTARVNAILGTELDDAAVAAYLEPIGFACASQAPGVQTVTVPTFRSDSTREIDVIEEVARHHGYGRVPRRRLRPPQVGGLDSYQRERRVVRRVVAGLGADEAWTPSLLGPDDHARAGMIGDSLTVANPLTPDESVLRRSLLPGMLRAVAFNAARRAGDVRLFEIGHVFPVPDAERLAAAVRHDDPGTSVVDERELLGMVFAADGDDATTAVAAWAVLAEALGLEDVEVDQGPVVAGLHPGRSATLVTAAAGGGTVHLGVVGEVDPDVAAAFGVGAGPATTALAGGAPRVGFFEVDLGAVLRRAARRPQEVRPVSRFPSSDVDLVFVVGDDVAAEALRRTLSAAGGATLEAVALFDVYRDPAMAHGERSLTYRLRFGADDRTLTDDDVAGLRRACVAAAEQAHRARLRG